MCVSLWSELSIEITHDLYFFIYSSSRISNYPITLSGEKKWKEGLRQYLWFWGSFLWAVLVWATRVKSQVVKVTHQPLQLCTTPDITTGITSVTGITDITGTTSDIGITGITGIFTIWHSPKRWLTVRGKYKLKWPRIFIAPTCTFWYSVKNPIDRMIIDK